MKMKDYFNFKAQDILDKRSCKKGDIILTSDPFACVLNNHHQGQYCDHCLASSREKTFICCKGCGYAWYCNDMCKFNASEIHNEECRGLKRLHPYIPPSLYLLMARVLRKVKNGKEKEMEFYAAKKGRKFKDLMNHYRDIKDDDNRMKEVRHMMEILKKMMGEDNFPNESDFIGIYGRVLVNRFCLTDSLLSPIGTGVYLSGSIFDHNCTPNAYPSFVGKKLVVRTLVDWEELDFTKVFISYIDIVASTNHRRMDLRANWYFWCYCQLCMCKERALYENCIKCENPFCEASVQIPEKPVSMFQNAPDLRLECVECGCPVDKDTIEEYQSAVAFTRQRLRGLKEENPSLETCMLIIEKQGTLFSSMNVWRVRTLDFVFNGSYYRGMWATALKYGEENLKGMRYYYGNEHPSLGLFLMKLGKVSLYLKMYRQGLKYLDEAEKIIIVSFGKSHPLIEDQIEQLRLIANEDLDILFERRQKAAAKKQEEHARACKHCGKHKNHTPASKAKKEDVKDIKKRLEAENERLAKKLQEKNLLVLKPKTEMAIANGINGHDEKEETNEEDSEEEVLSIRTKKDYKIIGRIDYSTNAKYLKFLFPVK